MFTGIVEAVGRIERVTSARPGVRLAIETGRLDLADVKVGDSIAVNGVCLTVTGLEGRCFTVDVSAETIACTQGLDRAASDVNLEKALRLSDRLGGHVVSGLVDGAGEVTAFEPRGGGALD